MGSTAGESRHRRPEEPALSLAAIAPSESLLWRLLGCLRRDGPLVCAHHVGRGAAAAERLDADTDLVLIVDEGPELAAAVQASRRRLPEAGIVAILAETALGETRRLLAAGADALVLEDEMDDVLPTALRSVSLGQVSVPRPLRELVEIPALSHRERQILALVVAGCTNAEIAKRLYLAESTVKTHLSSAFRRLGVTSRREATAAVLGLDDQFRLGVLTSVR
jgi:DNA-binding NarL/FixJ family response regulator